MARITDIHTLTPEEQARRNLKANAQQGLEQFDAALADLTDNWDSLDAPGKLAAVRAMLILQTRVARWLMARL